MLLVTCLAGTVGDFHEFCGATEQETDHSDMPAETGQVEGSVASRVALGAYLPTIGVKSRAMV